MESELASIMLTHEDKMLLLEEMTNGSLLLNNVTMLLESELFGSDGETSGTDTLLNKLVIGAGTAGRKPGGPMLPNRFDLDVRIQIGLYSVIFLLAILGNLAVILTLVQNQGMRTITNLFLLNLAIADLLVGVFCMPFTLVGIVLKDFVFGAAFCKLIPYLQGKSAKLVQTFQTKLPPTQNLLLIIPLFFHHWKA